jgi:hypothetical protein
MKSRFLLLAAFLYPLLCHQTVAGQTKTDRAVFINGLLDLTTALGKDGAPGVNQRDGHHHGQ